MKKLAIICAVLLGIVTGTVAAKGKKDSKSDDKISAPVVLVVGLEKGDVSSNYYMTEDIAENIKKPADSLEVVLTQVIMQSLSTSKKGDFSFVSCKSSDAHKEHIEKLMKEQGADYALLLNSYEVQWKGEPYYTLLHIVDFDLIDSKAAPVAEGKSYFESPELKPVEYMDKEYRKLADRIALQAHRAIK